MSEKLIIVARETLADLISLAEKVSDSEYKMPVACLSGSTLGQHIRHVVEFFLCLQKGLSTGVINYDRRERNKDIEENRVFSIRTIAKISEDLTSLTVEKSLTLQAIYGVREEKLVEIPTNLERELAYNIEHAIHHMAILKIGFKEIRSGIELPEGYGVASSTLRYQKTA